MIHLAQIFTIILLIFYLINEFIEYFGFKDLLDVNEFKEHAKYC